MPRSDGLDGVAEDRAARLSRWEFVVFSDDWDGVPLSCRHIVERWIPEHRVVWIETIGLRSPRLHAYDAKRVVEKAAGWLSRPQTEPANTGPNLVVRNPFQVPYNRYPWVRRLNGRLLERTALAALGPRQPGVRRALLTTCPFLGHIVGRLEEDVSVYYRVDDFSEFPGVDRRTIRTLEQSIMDRVDLIAATAESLTRTHRPDKVGRYLPHGVDFEHFAAGSAERLTPPGPVNGVPVPRVGFFGLLSEWIDLDLIAGVADQNPDWSIVLVGPTQLAGSELPRRPNIHYTGFVPYADLPHHAAAFDVALIPFRVNALTRAVNPLKLLEYFALGLPVVSTPLPEVVRYESEDEDVVRIAEGPEAFSEAIAAALAENGPAASERRRAIAREAGWRARAAHLLAWLEEVVPAP